MSAKSSGPCLVGHEHARKHNSAGDADNDLNGSAFCFLRQFVRLRGPRVVEDAFRSIGRLAAGLSHFAVLEGSVFYVPDEKFQKLKIPDENFPKISQKFRDRFSETSKTGVEN